MTFSRIPLLFLPLFLLLCLVLPRCAKAGTRELQISGIVISGLKQLAIHRNEQVIVGATQRDTLIFPVLAGDKIVFTGYYFEEARIHAGWKSIILNQKNPSYTLPNYQWSGKVKNRNRVAENKNSYNPQGFSYLSPLFSTLVPKSRKTVHCPFLWVDKKGKKSTILKVNGNKLAVKISEEPLSPSASSTLSLYRATPHKALLIRDLKKTSTSSSENGSINPIALSFSWQIDNHHPVKATLFDDTAFKNAMGISPEDISGLKPEKFLIQINQLYKNRFYHLCYRILNKKRELTGNALFTIMLEKLQSRVLLPFTLAGGVK